jgi:hypothetical protein
VLSGRYAFENEPAAFRIARAWEATDAGTSATTTTPPLWRPVS